MLATLGIIQSNSKGLPYTPPLDTYTGAAAAYSLRKLRTAYSGSAIRVRRSSDNVEQDIGFDGYGGLNESALTSFIGLNSGFVTKWYDQSGNGLDAVQTGGAQQPRLVNAGTIEKYQNKVNIYNDDLNDYLTFTINNKIQTVFGVYGKNAFIGQYRGLYSYRSSSSNLVAASNESGGINILNASYNITGLNATSIYTNGTSRNLANYLDYLTGVQMFNAQNIGLFTNIYTSSVSGTKNIVIGADTFTGNGSRSWGGWYYEIIFFSTDQSSNRTGIESNINSYYSIY